MYMTRKKNKKTNQSNKFENYLETKHGITLDQFNKTIPIQVKLPEGETIDFNEEANNRFAELRGLPTQTTTTEGSDLFITKHDYINNLNYVVKFELKTSDGLKIANPEALFR